MLAKKRPLPLSDVSKPYIQYWLFTLGNRNSRLEKMKEAKLPKESPTTRGEKPPLDRIEHHDELASPYADRTLRRKSTRRLFGRSCELGGPQDRRNNTLPSRRLVCRQVDYRLDDRQDCSSIPKSVIDLTDAFRINPVVCLERGSWAEHLGKCE
uniref:Uncharacterized protein n=1 Tax=Utricularia reniformis TaxID=192314 RepID=A0A1Y0B025_9LAMI|nr:hypothetical protein AEK19_MT0486 [Utricularia reniformis]ART30743.1 hypothetical protein AEK19_MT0486 [Utricularia reniformis]